MQQPNPGGQHPYAWWIRSLRRVWAAVRDEHPEVLRPCLDAHPDLEYSSAYAARMVRILMQQLDAETPVCTTVAHAHDTDHVADLLLERSGCRLQDALTSSTGRGSRFLSESIGSRAVDAAFVRRYRTLGCSVLDFEGRRYITLSSLLLACGPPLSPRHEGESACQRSGDVVAGLCVGFVRSSAD